MSSVGSLLKLLGALSFEGRVEYSSSILDIAHVKILRVWGKCKRSTHWEIRARRFRTSCLPTRCVQMKSIACVKVDAAFIVVFLALDMDFVDFKFDFVVESIVVEVEVEFEGQ